MPSIVSPALRPAPGNVTVSVSEMVAKRAMVTTAFAPSFAVMLFEFVQPDAPVGDSVIDAMTYPRPA